MASKTLYSQAFVTPWGHPNYADINLQGEGSNRQKDTEDRTYIKQNNKWGLSLELSLADIKLVEEHINAFTKLCVTNLKPKTIGSKAIFDVNSYVRDASGAKTLDDTGMPLKVTKEGVKQLRCQTKVFDKNGNKKVKPPFAILDGKAQNINDFISTKCEAGNFIDSENSLVRLVITLSGFLVENDQLVIVAYPKTIQFKSLEWIEGAGYGEDLLDEVVDGVALDTGKELLGNQDVASDTVANQEGEEVF